LLILLAQKEDREEVGSRDGKKATEKTVLIFGREVMPYFHRNRMLTEEK